MDRAAKALRQDLSEVSITENRVDSSIFNSGTVATSIYLPWGSTIGRV